LSLVVSKPDAPFWIGYEVAWASFEHVLVALDHGRAAGDGSAFDEIIPARHPLAHLFNLQLRC
jgi:hypothetical protein